MYCDDVSMQALGVSPEESPEDCYIVSGKKIFSLRILQRCSGMSDP